MKVEQEPKYTTNADGRIVNRASGNPIPDDEPVFILRAKDANAIKALRSYHMNCHNFAHRKIVAGRIADFERFAAEHPERMKEPDSP
jgi:hypothetical protein